MPRIFAITGAAGSGKDTIVSRLVQHGFVRLAFADPLKQAMQTITNDPLFTSTHHYHKEAHSPALDMSRRQALQVFGAEMRNIFGEGIWVNNLASRIEERRDMNIAISDCRYDNEAKALKEMGAVIIRVTRPDSQFTLKGVEAQHESERPISDTLVDVEISNDGTIEELHAEVDRLLISFPGGEQ